MQHANWNRDDGFEVMQDYLARFENIDAVWAQDDDIALVSLRRYVKQTVKMSCLSSVGRA